jgi:hypothetical protein
LVALDISLTASAFQWGAMTFTCELDEKADQRGSTAVVRGTRGDRLEVAK